MKTGSAVTTPADLRRIITGMDTGVVVLKPRIFFGAVERRLGRPVEMSLPVPSSAIGSVTLLEAAIMTSLVKLLEPSQIFEFGTFMGYMTGVFLRNSKPGTKVVSLDLPRGSERPPGEYDIEQVMSDFRTNDAYLTSMQAYEGHPFLGVPETDSVVLLKKDSRFFDPGESHLDHSCGLVFVDGGHDEELARIDTENAVKMLVDRGCIAWHDVGSTLHTDVDLVIEDFASKHVVFLVESTMLAIHLSGGAVDVLLD